MSLNMTGLSEGQQWRPDPFWVEVASPIITVPSETITVGDTVEVPVTATWGGVAWPFDLRASKHTRLNYGIGANKSSSNRDS